ncbi:hypothetical protein D7Z26_13495 [Cohnella endophytica]|uniref:Uncharacterized protein n=1 Tax=Cohnella endophytica TaxID=2419778 RepID=A0A494Y385_9BACL|nr:hypothetical protein [Cohnella endophytica]RKP54366.1 hypothetical protein D7Z26_13495 [Cohnella endophytica]
MVHIQFLDLKIGSISESSGVFSGQNQQYKYKHASKQNQAFGKVSGLGNTLTNTRAELNDRDRIDMKTIKHFRMP